MKKTPIETQIWTIHSNDIRDDHPDILQAAEWLRQGKLIAFPTETVYGLGADARSTSAVEAIYKAKGRPSDNPLIVHIADRSQLDGLVSDDRSTEERVLAEQLISRFWPGPLTLVMPLRTGAVSGRVTAGLSTVAVRMPDHPLALALIRAAGCPVAAPSANRSGRPSPTTARHVEDDLAGRIAGILDGGQAVIGLESTVVAISSDGLELLRPGSVTQQQLREAAPGIPLILPAELHHELSDNESRSSESENVSFTPRSPGMKYAHYAPRGEMRVVISNPAKASTSVSSEPSDKSASSMTSSASREAVVRHAQRLFAEAKRQGRRTGILTYSEYAVCYQDVDHVAVCGSIHDLNHVARQLYDTLRSFDEENIDFILAEGCPEEGIGEAIMNRLMKAAAYRTEIVP